MGNITETVPASFNVAVGGAQPSQNATAGTAQKTFSGDTQTLSWPVNLKKGDSVTLGYSFKAPDISPELYKLGPLQIGNWVETRQWQIAADVIADKVIFITSTSTTSWAVPTDWNNASNSIEVIGGGGGGGNSGNFGDGGGGGGAYAKIANFDVGASTTIKIQVGAGGAQNVSGTISFWGGSGAVTTCTGKSVCADFGGVGGVTSDFGTGGTTLNSSGTTKNAGGNGGTGNSTGDTGGGGGGAGGPLGTGAVGGNGGATTSDGGGGGGGSGGSGALGIGQNASSSGGRGGAGPGGSGGGAGGTGVNGTAATAASGGGGGGGDSDKEGAAGATYTEWDSTHGSGGGGGGGADACTNGDNSGARYGGGGGGSDCGGGTGGDGIIVITYTPLTITIADGTQPTGVTVGPGANATTSAVFSLLTNFGTSTITLATTTVSTSSGIYQIQITNSAGTTVYGSSTNPTTNINSISLSGMNVSTTATTFLIMIKPLDATSMPAVPGDNYVVTSTFTEWTDSKNQPQAGANTTSSPITIDNGSPGDVTNASGTASGGQVALSWANPGDLDFATTTILRATSSITVVPTEGVYYNVGDPIGATTVACVASSTVENCTDTNVVNGTAYYYKIFTADTYLNYSAGAFQGTLPLTPSANSSPIVSSVSLNHGNPIILSPNATASIDINYTVQDDQGCADVLNTTSTAFRGGISSTCAVPNPTTNNLNCYLFLTHTTSSCVGNAFNSTDTVGIYYFAQSTGNTSSSFPLDTWYAYASAIDSFNTTGTATSSNVDVNVLLALNIVPSSINYGTVNASSTTGAVNQSTTIQNVGNASQTLKIYGTALTFNSNKIATSSQHYATSSFTFGGSEQELNEAAQSVSGFLLTSPTSTNAVSSQIFWGITVPAGNVTGTYSGTNVFTAFFSQ